MHSFKLLDFKTFDVFEDYIADNIQIKMSKFCIQIFGLNEKRVTYSCLVKDYKPYFYVKVHDSWNYNDCNNYVKYLNKKLVTKLNTNYKTLYAGNDSDLVLVSQLLYCCKFEIVHMKKLYGFDDGKKHTFIKLYFNSNKGFTSAKGLWFNDRILINGGIKYKNSHIELYEAQIPPLLRFFHENEISPSGWVKISNKYVKLRTKKTYCDIEIITSYANVIGLDEDKMVPYKICSFDIEASSSHGDFPLPIKSYKKLVTEILDNYSSTLDENKLTNCILCAFGFYQEETKISRVYVQQNIDEDVLVKAILKILNFSVNDEKSISLKINIEDMFSKETGGSDDESGYPQTRNNTNVKRKPTENYSIRDMIKDATISKEFKSEKLNNALTINLPDVKGDEVTFIGTTFINYGEEHVYKNHCVVLNGCKKLDTVEHAEVVSCKTEKDLLIEWKNLIIREDPDIIIGYNIFGFDYEFMFRRAYENDCLDEFLKISRNVDELCATKDRDGVYHIQETSIVLASGQHNLNYINTSGRLQIDLYNYFRRDYNLASYKLDSVAGYFIGDDIKHHEFQGNKTILYCKNLSGLSLHAFVHIEEINHTNEYINSGEKYEVVNINTDAKSLTLRGEVKNMDNKKLRWCLAKDDVTPQDIFRMTNGSDEDRAIVAKYCIQDCNLVHSLLKKIDIMTGFIEMSKLCSVPIAFLVLRGQGIKLTSFIAKKCREKNTLMPVIKNSMGDDEGYEGAIVLEPKCGIYLDNPVACVDYSSLYPSSMISENLCHSSKVWTKEYDLDGNFIEGTGEVNKKTGEYVYDNLAGYTYVDVEYDTYTYRRKSAKAAAQKIKIGTKVCRFAESIQGKAILPSVLQELLYSRKATKKQMNSEEDPFMKNILDKRQLSIKLTANSLYGQCGAKTSAFYEKDVAACTTATGRKLLIYAKNLIEGVYGDCVCDTKNGKVKTNAEYIYGDTDSVFFTFNLKRADTNEPIIGKDALALTIELAQEAGELASKFLKMPHDLEYEKTFMPFCLLSKKRYVGMLYELDENKCKCKSMGIVLKRRDNAPIVKDIYGGIIDILMNEKDIAKSLEFLDKNLNIILSGNCPFDKFIITKSLRSGYKNPNQIAHKVLADRMGERDGVTPSPGDRIPYIYITTKTRAKLQGDKIEHPDYIRLHNLNIDYGHYITNQIMRPILQIYSLVIFDLPSIKSKSMLKLRIKKELAALAVNNQADYAKKSEVLKNKYVERVLFDKYIKMSENKKNNMREISSYFG